MSTVTPAQRKTRAELRDKGLGLIATTGSSTDLSFQSSLAAQTLRGTALGLRAGDVVSAVVAFVQAAGTGTSGVVSVGLADSSYNKLVSVADVNNPRTVTVTIATPGVFSLTAHGFVAGDPVSFKTTGSLPTGLSVDTVYFVIAAGLTADAFEVSTTSGGSAVNTSGSQSGVHTITRANLRVTGLQPLPITPYTITADGLYYPVIDMTTAYGTVQPALAAGSVTGMSSGLFGLPVPAFVQTGQSSIPNPITPGASAVAIWFGVK